MRSTTPYWIISAQGAGPRRVSPSLHVLFTLRNHVIYPVSQAIFPANAAREALTSAGGVRINLAATTHGRLPRGLPRAFHIDASVASIR